MSLRRLLSLLTALVLLTFLTVLHAQDTPRIGYYRAADANNVQQVYQFVENADTEPRQITHAKQDVLGFGAAYDGLSVAYISEDKLWLQPIHTEEAEVLTDLSKPTSSYMGGVGGNPIFSPDGQFIAYADGGLWLLDLSTRTTRQLLTDTTIQPDGTNAGLLRLYGPEQFLVGADGKVDRLIVEIGLWEWGTAGVYDLSTNTLHEFNAEDSRLYAHLLPLHDGRVLIFGNNPSGSKVSLELAESLNDISTFTPLLDLARIKDGPLPIQQAVELTPGVVRLFGSRFQGKLKYNSAFIFDYDISAGTTSDITYSPAAGPASYGPLSADGQLVPVYLHTKNGETITSQFSLLNLETGDLLQTSIPADASNFQWQPSL